MNVTAVIAEYNPFHNGHAYQLHEIRKQTDCDYIIALMSGNYTQRGIPALCDKELRTQMALESGADLVLELPLLYATGSAELFAFGAVELLNRLGVINQLAFGIERKTDLTLYQSVISSLKEETVPYQNTLRYYLKSGLSFPAAREKALYEQLSSYTNCSAEAFHQIFSSNNLLGIEYEKALARSQSSITPVRIPRIGKDYHDTSLDETVASASGIRQLISNHTETTLASCISSYVPSCVYRLLKETNQKTQPIFADDFSSQLQYLLIRNQTSMPDILDCTPSIWNRMQNERNSFTSYLQYATFLKSKEVTYSRLCRIFLHFLLNLTSEDATMAKEEDGAHYARICGFQKRAQPLLHSIRKKGSLPLISKAADAARLMPAPAVSLFEKNMRANELYHAIAAQKFKIPVKNEYRTPIVICDTYN